MTRPLVSVLMGDPRLPDENKPGGRYTPDDFEQIDRLKSALEEIADYRFEYLDDHTRLLDDLRTRPPAFVLNFCDTGFRNQAALELHIASYLEMLGIPYSGTGPVALGLCYDKALVCAVAQSLGIAVPRERFLRPDEPLSGLEFPAFIKPNRGDGSVGITAESIVHDTREAAAYVERLRTGLPKESLVVQELLDGDEYGVGIIGNPADGFVVLPVLEVDYSALDPSLPRLLDYSSKTDPSSPYWTDIRFREARIDESMKAHMRDWCQLLFQRLGLRDYARFDFRADANGAIKLMEVNPNPAWCWDGKLAHMAGLMGERHSGLLRLIIQAAWRRCFGKS